MTLVLLLATTAPSEAASTELLAAGGDLQAAISASTPGGQIHLEAGTYTGCYTVLAAKDLTIIGLDGAGAVTLTCADAAKPTLDVKGTLRLEGVTVTETGGFRGANVTGTLTAQNVTFAAGLLTHVDGAGIYADGGDVYLRGVLFDGTATTANGGGLALENGSYGDVRESTFDASSAGLSGGGVYITFNSTLYAWNSTITGASANNGGALYDLGYATLDGCDVASSSAFASAGGAYVLGSLYGHDTVFEDDTQGALVIPGGYSLLERADFERNTAVTGGAVDLSSGTLDCSACTFQDNTATGIVLVGVPDQGGGALFVSGGYAATHESSFLGNGAGSAAGGAVYAEGGSTWYSYGDLFDGNTAAQGGAIYLDISTTLRDAVIQDNIATDAGGGLYVGDDDAPTLEGVQLLGNTATNDGGGASVHDRSSFYTYGAIFSGNSAGSHGGGLSATKNTYISLDTTEVTANTAADGGGYYGDNATLYSINSDWTYNSATGDGGGIAASRGYVSVNETRINHNSAGVYGGGTWADATQQLYSGSASQWCDDSAQIGGGIYASNLGGSGNTFNNPIFQENTATSEGGAVWAEGGTGSQFWYLNFATVIGNSAPSYGGIATDGFAALPLEIDAEQSIFWANSDSGLDSLGATWAETYYSLFGTGLGNVSNISGNYTFVNPLITGWTATASCDEDLTAYASSSDGGAYSGAFGWGVGAGTGYWSSDFWGDADLDGWTLAEGDCNDFDSRIYPTRPEVPFDFVDQDCTLYDPTDGDGDGYNSVGYGGADCNDGTTATNPGIIDVADGIDRDCDGDLAFESDRDRDRDADAVDCGPDDPTIGPLAIDVPYDGVDANCDGNDDDVDGDGVDAVAAGGTDCDDYEPTAYPGGTEIWYDGIDEDCDGNDADQDLDGHLADFAGGDDCDDGDPAVYPGAAEIWYDGVDEDCAGDDDFDQDVDGYEQGLDCDDTDPDIHPGAVEIPDLLDDDCDGYGDPDTDSDGVIDYWELQAGTAINDVDTDHDGADDGVEWGNGDLGLPVDTDGDSTPDVLDDDSDGDGVKDRDETGDTDGDGVDDRVDTDDDGDGVPTADELADGAGDLDGDGLPDWLDPDRDGDGSVDGSDPSPGDPGGDSDSAITAPGAPSRYGLGCDSSGGAPALGWMAAAAALARRRGRRK